MLSEIHQCQVIGSGHRSETKHEGGSICISLPKEAQDKIKIKITFWCAAQQIITYSKVNLTITQKGKGIKDKLVQAETSDGGTLDCKI